MTKTSRWVVYSKGKVVAVLKQVPCHEDVLESGLTAPCILSLGTGWSLWSTTKLFR